MKKAFFIILLTFGVLQLSNAQDNLNIQELKQAETTQKIATLLHLINNFYVDTHRKQFGLVEKLK